MRTRPSSDAQAIDDARLVALINYRGMTPREVSICAGHGPDYLNGYLRGRTGRMAFENVIAIADVLRVPLDAVRLSLGCHGGPMEGWHCVDQRTPTDLPRVLSEMATADCITAVSDDMDSYLIPDPMVEVIHREKFSNFGLTGAALGARVDVSLRMAVLRRELRKGHSYVHQVIAPGTVARRAVELDSRWSGLIRDALAEYRDETPVGLVPPAHWPAFYSAISSVLPQNIEDWRKINIADDIIACVWTRLDIWYTYHGPWIKRLRAAVKEATRKWVGPDYPSEIDGFRGSVRQDLRRWHRQADAAFQSFLR